MHPAITPHPAPPPFLAGQPTPPPGITPAIEAYFLEREQQQLAEKAKVTRRARYVESLEARQILDNCSRITLQRLLRKGLVKSYRRPGACKHLFLVGELEDLKARLARPQDGRIKGFRRTSNPAHQTKKGAPIHD